MMSQPLPSRSPSLTDKWDSVFNPNLPTDKQDSVFNTNPQATESPTTENPNVPQEDQQPPRTSIQPSFQPSLAPVPFLNPDATPYLPTSGVSYSWPKAGATSSFPANGAPSRNTHASDMPLANLEDLPPFLPLAPLQAQTRISWTPVPPQTPVPWTLEPLQTPVFWPPAAPPVQPSPYAHTEPSQRAHPNSPPGFAPHPNPPPGFAPYPNFAPPPSLDVQPIAAPPTLGHPPGLGTRPGARPPFFPPPPALGAGPNVIRPSIFPAYPAPAPACLPNLSAVTSTSLAALPRHVNGTSGLPANNRTTRTSTSSGNSSGEAASKYGNSVLKNRVKPRAASGEDEGNGGRDGDRDGGNVREKPTRQPIGGPHADELILDGRSNFARRRWDCGLERLKKEMDGEGKECGN
ncbi:hypothetical protein K458DRAFT_120369 [Lentithecium fluviatile CBS 122367]|uniref:Uncharacterized protein n=1 Tax=Lentithecium fluviatile CBS 122367 TaxID=1168545 RepID=A0A6G1IMC7_9PLEO|nr:hypothetical protein K458DRAFT_120369 [Lentithecium fluviatile CBS 122367]